MADNLKRKCVKRGLSPNADDPNIKNIVFLNQDQQICGDVKCGPNVVFQTSFGRLSTSNANYILNIECYAISILKIQFINIEEKKLSKHAVPDMIDFDEKIEVQPMNKLCEDNIQVSKHEEVSELDYTIESVPGPSRVLMDITNENHEKLVSLVPPKKIQKLNDTALYKKCRKYLYEKNLLFA